MYQSGSFDNALKAANREHIDEYVDRFGEIILSSRDSAGANALHKLAIFNTNAHILILKQLLEKTPSFICEQYEGEKYEGESLIHIAIVNRRTDLVKFLVQNAPSVLCQRAVGTFFKPSSSCYFGELPLSFAASDGNLEMADILIKHGADLSLEDAYGNNALHMCVIYERVEMYDHLVQKWIAIVGNEDCCVQLWKRPNAMGLTCLALAAARKSKIMFTHILNRAKRLNWVYGDICCVLYPIDQLDSSSFALQCARRDNPRRIVSAIECLVDASAVELATLECVETLMTRKWETFAKRIFMTRFYVHLIFLAIACVIVILPGEKDGVENVDPSLFMLGFFDTIDQLKTLRRRLEMACLVYCFSKASLEYHELRREGFARHFCDFRPRGLENIVSAVWIVSIVALAIHRVLYECDTVSQNYLSSRRFEDFLCAWIILGGFLQLLWFLFAWRRTGPFIVMLQDMLLRDVSVFVILSSVFLLGFSIALFALSPRPRTFEDLFDEFVRFLFVTVGEITVPDSKNNKTTWPRAEGLFILAYACVLLIVLLNILVAKLGDTFSRIAHEAEGRWLLQKYRIIQNIEESCDAAYIKERRYWIAVESKPYIQVEERANDKKGGTQFGVRGGVRR